MHAFMNSKRACIVVGMVLLGHGAAMGGEALYNGIVLPDQWPPEIRHFSRDPWPVPYRDNPPAVIPIDVGRQLFVDDFLVQSTTLIRTFHTPTWHAASPVLLPDMPWEAKGRNLGDPPTAHPFSDGVWYDSRDKRFKMWYMGGYFQHTCYAESVDGVHWVKPMLDVKPGTNIVYDRLRDSSTVWLDPTAGDPDERFKMMYFSLDRKQRELYTKFHLHCSPDGKHWSEQLATAGPVKDRSTFFYNPFRKKWVISIKDVQYDPATETVSEEAEAQAAGRRINGGNLRRLPRMRRYAEGDTLIGAATSWSKPCQPTMWLGADRLDLPRVDIGTKPELYNLDAVAYESLMIGLLTIWRGVPSNHPARDKINNVCLAYSRDGFHWDRPSRDPFLNVSEDPDAWNYSNVQSCGGFLVVGDLLYIYASGRQTRNTDARDGVCGTGLATLRRDGFASMDAGPTEGTLTTRPVRFSGKHLFVNLDAPEGQLLAEVLDANGQVISPFTKENCIPVAGDGTRLSVRWEGAPDLSRLAGTPVRLRFFLEDGSLYAFWVSAERCGASGGYVANGGPGFGGPLDVAPSSRPIPGDTDR